MHAAVLQVPTTEESTKPFPYPLPLDPNTKTLASIPLALFYPGVLALAAAAGMMGNTVGRGLPGEAQTLVETANNTVFSTYRAAQQNTKSAKLCICIAVEAGMALFHPACATPAAGSC